MQSQLDVCDVVVLLEVLEHIEQDIYVLSIIPLGKQVVITVPNFDAKGHVRFFDNLDVIKERYGFLIEFGEEQILPHAERHQIFVLKGIRR